MASLCNPGEEFPSRLITAHGEPQLGERGEDWLQPRKAGPHRTPAKLGPSLALCFFATREVPQRFLRPLPAVLSLNVSNFLEIIPGTLRFIEVNYVRV